jgi:uncharacterized membrane protein (DUF2068 family)
MSPVRATASVVIAGVIAILGSVLAVLACLVRFVGALMLRAMPAGQQPAAFARTFTMVILATMLAIAVFGVFTGAGVIRLKKWGAYFHSGVVGSDRRVVLIELAGHDAGSFAAAQQPSSFDDHVENVSVLFDPHRSRDLVADAIQHPQSQGSVCRNAGDAAGSPVKPHCPLPVAIIAGFLLFSSLSIMLVPFFGWNFPIIVFGRAIHGPLGWGMFVFSGVLLAVGSVGLLRLKRWGYPIVVGMQAFWLASGTVTFLSPSYDKTCAT